MPCADDRGCDTAKGDLCCDYGEDGKACVPATACPRLCDVDTNCDTATGQTCGRTSLSSPLKVCTAATSALRLCGSDAACGTGEVCCTAYAEPICAAATACPHACDVSTDCMGQRGALCCTTLGVPHLAKKGVCLDPTINVCPTACTTSSDCPSADAKLCCEGTCRASCANACTTSSDCDHQICCRTRALQSPFARPAPTLPVTPSDADLGRATDGFLQPGDLGSPDRDAFSPADGGPRHDYDLGDPRCAACENAGLTCVQTLDQACNSTITCAPYCAHDSNQCTSKACDALCPTGFARCTGTNTCSNGANGAIICTK